jgi:hypothetical protein
MPTTTLLLYSANYLARLALCIETRASYQILEDVYY